MAVAKVLPNAFIIEDESAVESTYSIFDSTGIQSSGNRITIEADCTIDQDLQQSAVVSFSGVSATGLNVGAGGLTTGDAALGFTTCTTLDVGGGDFTVNAAGNVNCAAVACATLDVGGGDFTVNAAGNVDCAAAVCETLNVGAGGFQVDATGNVTVCRTIQPTDTVSIGDDMEGPIAGYGVDIFYIKRGVLVTLIIETFSRLGNNTNELLECNCLPAVIQPTTPRFFHIDVEDAGTVAAGILEIPASSSVLYIGTGALGSITPVAFTATGAANHGLPAQICVTYSLFP
jgi:hypothetical protein